MINKKDFIQENDVETKQGRDSFLSLVKQIDKEFNIAWKHQEPKKKEWEMRLKLYNNQRRDKKAIGDTTMFTIHQTIVASLYIDRLNVTFEGREEGDEETAENLNAMALYDYDSMDKDIIDYEWIWDASFFGRGLVEMSEFERDPENNIYVPVPRVLDPITFMRDPLATSVNGDRMSRGACRFHGQPVRMTKKEIEDHPHMFDDIDFKSIAATAGIESTLDNATQARNDAQGNQSNLPTENESGIGDNSVYAVTEWNTHWKMGDKVQKVKVWLVNDQSKVIGLQKLKHDRWQIIDRPLYPISHDWDGVSIPDLTEDKQRARAVLQNLGLDVAKTNMYPTYVYDKTKFNNRKDLKFNLNKFIGIDALGESVLNSIAPIQKSQPDMQLTSYIMDTLDLSAQKATATPEMQQGLVSSQDRTLGELNIVNSKVETRYSLSAKVFGWSEKRFWREWYMGYKDNFGDNIDEKILRVVGAFGAKWRPLKRDNIVTRTDPDIHIESEIISRAKQIEERQSLAQYFSLALQDPGSNRLYGLKKFGRVSGLKKDEIERLFPKSIDEREAEAENDLLNVNEIVRVLVEQDHNVHLEVHSKANETIESIAHIKTHEEALKIKRVRPELFPQPEQSEGVEQNPQGSTQLHGQQTAPTQSPQPQSQGQQRQAQGNRLQP